VYPLPFLSPEGERKGKGGIKLLYRLSKKLQISYYDSLIIAGISG